MESLLKKLKEKKGFTLIEMIIVIAIIAILIALIAPNMMKFLDTAKITKAEAAAKTLYTSAQAYATEAYVANKAVVTSFKKGDHKDDFDEEYFNEDELKSITSFEVKLTEGVVTEASVKMADGKEGKYPQNSTQSSTSSKAD